jgi:hypothetical protein
MSWGFRTLGFLLFCFWEDHFVGVRDDISIRGSQGYQHDSKEVAFIINMKDVDSF